MREIVLDTETTGLDCRNGDRLIELGCIELVNRRPTGAEFHAFLNPEGRLVHPDAERVHGISNAFLMDRPLFAVIADQFREFIGSSALVVHNAGFDLGFINMEFERIGQATISMERVVDTLTVARRKHPAGPNSLDALCKRYGIDGTQRSKHGALVDSHLLAQVYLELLGERQAVLSLTQHAVPETTRDRQWVVALKRPVPLKSRLTAADEAAHAAFVAGLGGTAIWKRYALQQVS